MSPFLNLSDELLFVIPQGEESLISLPWPSEVLAVGHLFSFPIRDEKAQLDSMTWGMGKIRKGFCPDRAS